MPITEHNHLIQAVPSVAAIEPFHVGILPGALRGPDGSSRAMMPAQPRPVLVKTFTLPGKYGLRLDEYQNLPPLGPMTGKP